MSIDGAAAASPQPALPGAAALIERAIAEGLYPGAQLYVSRGRRPMAELALGEARPGVPMTPDTLLLWLSSGKPATAVALLRRNMLVYGVGGVLLPFVAIKLIDMALVAIF